jgi:hypothetical protein
VLIKKKRNSKILQLLLGGFKTVIVDNLDNSSEVAVHRVKELAAEFGNNLNFHKVLFFFNYAFFCSILIGCSVF